MPKNLTYTLNSSEAKRRKEYETKLSANVAEITRLIAESKDLCNKLGFTGLETLLKDAGAFNYV